MTQFLIILTAAPQAQPQCLCWQGTRSQCQCWMAVKPQANPGPQLPCCPYLFFFIHAANCQTLYLPGWCHSCAGTSLGSHGCDALWEHHDPVWAPVCARPWQAQPGCKWCKRHRLFHGCSASASWPVSLAQLGNAASSSWWAASSGLAWITGEGGSCKLLESSERHFKAPCMEQAAVWL